eukprot:COSAG06_NODE_63870_length_261_cov_0.635802_2_plen_43_part_01
MAFSLQGRVVNALIKIGALDAVRKVAVFFFFVVSQAVLVNLCV